MDKRFKLTSGFKPSGDQPGAIEELSDNIKKGSRSQVLLGVTCSGKTYTIANVIEKLQRPALVIAPNKILAAQLYAEFKAFFPENAVEYFISYYDYYQPEAYIPQTDTFIEKDSAINDHIDRLRLKATSSLLERRDVIIVASVSCIYNLGSPQEYRDMCVFVEKGAKKSRDEIIAELIAINYERNEVEFSRGKVRVRGDTIEVFMAYLETALRIELFGNEIEKISEINPVTGEVIAVKDSCLIYPARHYVMPKEEMEKAVERIEAELAERLAALKNQNKLLEYQRLDQRTRYDIEMMKETGFCRGIENYSRVIEGRPAGSRPSCLLDYFIASTKGTSDDFITIIDESHVTVPQIRGMYEGDKSRKETLVNYGFRLPSALDNRPLKFNEFESLVKDIIFVSATPGPYELAKTKGAITELIIRPTGLIDPEVIIRPIGSQVQDLITEIRACVEKKQRVLVTTLTKKMAEDLADYLSEKEIKVSYLHSDIDALERIDILKNLRLGKFDVLVGINLLREGLDLPEVALVAVLGADKEGFLRSETTLIQVCGRAARNLNGKVILYADKMTGSMQRAIDEMSRRRRKQEEYNVKNKITPRSIVKAVHDLEEFQYHAKEEGLKNIVSEVSAEYITPGNINRVTAELEKQMREAADNLDFELAAALRDKIIAISEMAASSGKRRTVARRKK